MFLCVGSGSNSTKLLFKDVELFASNSCID